MTKFKLKKGNGSFDDDGRNLNLPSRKKVVRMETEKKNVKNSVMKNNVSKDMISLMTLFSPFFYLFGIPKQLFFRMFWQICNS